MSNSTELNTFPSTKVEALTLLYLQNQDLSDISPEKLVDEYEAIYARIKQRFSDRRSMRMSAKC